MSVSSFSNRAETATYKDENRYERDADHSMRKLGNIEEDRRDSSNNSDDSFAQDDQCKEADTFDKIGRSKADSSKVTGYTHDHQALYDTYNISALHYYLLLEEVMNLQRIIGRL